MSTLKADTIVASDGTSPVTLTKQASLRMMCFFNQSGSETFGLAQDQVGATSLNVSSVTDDATGRWKVNLTNAHSTEQLVFLSGARADNNTQTRRSDNGNSTSVIVTQSNDADSNAAQDQANYCATSGDLA